jgi:hypothetical protein
MSDHFTHHLSEEERAKVVLQVDYFVDILSKRYGIEPNEIVEVVNQVREWKARNQRLTQAGYISLIGIIISAAMLAFWEGIKRVVFLGGPK